MISRHLSVALDKVGTSFFVPDEVGVEMELSVDRLLNGDED